MGILRLLEFEELVGERWHRLVGETASYRNFPEAAVSLTDVKGALAVFFRALGGDAAITFAGSPAVASRHRLGLRQRIGLAEERIEQPWRDQATLHLPVRLAAFDDRALNRQLYFWLAAFFVHHGRGEVVPADPLARDLAFLREVRLTTARALAAAPGLAGLHRRLSDALIRLRPRRALPPDEAAVEQAVLALLGGGEGGPFWPAVVGDAMLGAFRAPARYRPFLPVPLWGEVVAGGVGTSGAEAGEASGGISADARDGQVRKARRRESDQAGRRDSLIFNRFEKILTLVESLNINRPVEDDDEAGARKALDDAEEIGIASRAKKASTRLKFDLDLPPPALDAAPVMAERSYPEWDYTHAAYLPDHCRVVTGIASEQGESWEPDAAVQRRIRLVRRQFEAFRPRPEMLRAQLDGGDIDLEALVRSRTDLAAGGIGTDRIYLTARRQARDLSVALLVDVSLSTDSWIDNRRVLDIEKEALLVLAHGISACGDDHALFTFTSRRRDWVKVDTIKDFDAPFDATTGRRIGALMPGFYTRMGAALRHVTAILAERQSHHRLLLLLTDGKPNDVDHYEGRYGIEDTRRAVQEARRAGVAVFGVTIDRAAQEHFPVLFGRDRYTIVADAGRLPAALPALYRQLRVN